MAFISLPTDLQMVILSTPGLQAYDICKMRLVCKAFRDLIDQREHNTIWPALWKQEGLEVFTPEELKQGKTYKLAFQLHWVFHRRQSKPKEISSGYLGLKIDPDTRASVRKSIALSMKKFPSKK